jgi:hypothetical protein
VVAEPVASEIAQALAGKGLQASVRSLPPWPSATPNPGEAIVVDIAGEPRPIALVEWAKVTAYGPPSMSEGRWAAESRRRSPWVMPVPEIVSGLHELAKKWSRDPEALGVLELVFTLLDGLPPIEGGYRAQLIEREAWIGVERGGLRWPAFARIDLRRGIELIHAPPPPAQASRWSPRTRADLRRDREAIATSFGALDAWCQRFVAEKRALDRFAGLACVELARAHLPPWGAWTIAAPAVSMFSTRDRPAAFVQWDGGMTRIATDDAGHLTVDGATFRDDTPMTTLAETIAAKARTSFTFQPGQVYRLRRPLEGLLAGDLLRFRRSGETHDCAGFYEFEAVDPRLPRGSRLVDGATGFRGLALYESDAAHALVLQSPGDWFELVVDAQIARAAHVDALVAAARVLLEADVVDDAEVRLREALALDPDHVDALFQSGWAAVKRGSWQDAHALFARVCALDPRHLDARNNTAWALGRLGRWLEALPVLDALVLERPGWKLAHTNRAWVLRGLGRADEASVDEERARGL